MNYENFAAKELLNQSIVILDYQLKSGNIENPRAILELIKAAYVLLNQGGK